MTEDPGRYENYPPTADPTPTAPADPVADPLAGPAPSGWMATPAPAGWTASPPPPPNPAPSRRLLLGGLVAVGVLAVPVIFGMSRDGGMTEPGGGVSAEAEPDDQQNEDDYDVGGLTVSVPAGWTVASNNDHRLVIRQGGTTVTFLSYAAGQDATAADEAEQQLRRYADVRRSTKQATTSDTVDQIETAEAVLSGEVDGKPVEVSSQVRIDTDTDDYDAAAVVSVILTTAAKDLRTEIDRLRRDFLEQLG